MFTGFNPYFPGVTFQSLITDRRSSERRLFQSLFSWSYLSKANMKPGDKFDVTFQSLFSWSYLSKFSKNETGDPEEISFNPYFPGVTFQRGCFHDDVLHDGEFQSLFSWSYLSKLYQVFIVNYESLSFNPYFPGVTFQRGGLIPRPFTG